MIDISTNKRKNMAIDLLPDLTPLLDIMFLLIVFFILTANAVPYALDVNLPTDENSVVRPIEDQDIINITLKSDDTYKISDRIFNDKSLFQDHLKEKIVKTPKAKVIISGDKNVPMQTLLSVLTFMRAENIPAADIIMNKE